MIKCLALLCLLCTAVSAQRIPIILDTDIGDAIDDALALALALNSPELDVRAVTTVIDDVDSKTRLAWKMLGIYNRRDIPLATGASEPLSGPASVTHSKEFDVLTSDDTIPDSARRRAADLIIETVMKARSKITVVAIGPLTNIALALKSEPKIKNNIERIVIMGGAYLTTEEEYNFKRDPVAQKIVFDSALPITAVGLDVTRQCKLRENDLDRLRVAESPEGRFLLRLVNLAAQESGDRYPTLYDPLAIAVVFRPNLIETQAHDRTTTQVGIRVDAPAFLDLFIRRVSSSGLNDLPR